MNKKQEVIVWLVSLYLLFVVVFEICMVMDHPDPTGRLYRSIPEIILFTFPAAVVGALLVMSFRTRKE